MGISDRLRGKPSANGKPHIEAVSPSSALPGGEVRITGKSLRAAELRRPRVQFGDVEGAVVMIENIVRMVLYAVDAHTGIGDLAQVPQIA